MPLLQFEFTFVDDTSVYLPYSAKAVGNVIILLVFHLATVCPFTYGQLLFNIFIIINLNYSFRNQIINVKIIFKLNCSFHIGVKNALEETLLWFNMSFCAYVFYAWVKFFYNRLVVVDLGVDCL